MRGEMSVKNRLIKKVVRGIAERGSVGREMFEHLPCSPLENVNTIVRSNGTFCRVTVTLIGSQELFVF